MRKIAIHLAVEDDGRYNAAVACGKVFPAWRWTRNVSSVTCAACLRVHARSEKRKVGDVPRRGIVGRFDR